MEKKILLVIGLILFIISLWGPQVEAQQAYRWKAVVTSRVNPQFELWTWLASELDKRTNGQIKLDLTSLPEVGLTGAEMLRMTRAGLVDIADVSLTYVSGDLPVLEAVDLPGIFPDFETSVKAHHHFLQAVKKYEDKLGAVCLGGYMWAETTIFSRKPVRTPADMKGLKLRIFGAALTDFAKAIGAEPVSISFAEVYTALERGTIDGAFTGTYAGFSMKWYEVCKYMIDVKLGPSSGTFQVSKKTWDKLTPELRTLLTKVGEEFSVRGWDLGRRNSQEGIEKNKEKGVEWIPMSPAMASTVKDAVTKVVVPNWVNRVGPEGKEVFNTYIAPYSGFKAP
jgi:TRAP-type C4-dicarboxylate transport system substrate-binding protein